ncbi:MAG TPA: transmembrane domain-containing protein [Glycomyces sp.]
MLSAPPAARAAARATGLAAAVAPFLLAAGCATEPPTQCASPGDTYVQTAILSRERTDELEYVTFILVCTPEGTVAIVDEEGNDYESLDDFQRSNDLYDDEDELLLPANFPEVDDPAAVTSVPAHKPVLSTGQVIGGVALVALVGVFLGLAVRQRRRKAALEWEREWQEQRLATERANEELALERQRKETEQRDDDPA